MAKKIQIEHENVVYTLEYTLRTVKTMEARGFKIDELSEYPATRIPQLFFGAFLAHHSGIRQEQTDAIWDAQADRDALLEVLGEMYGDTLNALMDDKSKNGKRAWKVI